MKDISNILIKNKIFIIPYILFLSVSFFFLLKYDKAEIHIFLNTYHNRFFDILFKYWTHLGDGFFAVIITLVFLFIKYKWAIISAVSTFLTAITVQFLKRVVFTNNFRPKFFFQYLYEGNYNLYLIEGSNPGTLFSFPSGHSASAFAVFFLLSIIVKDQRLKLAFFIIALSSAFSRVYLSWHFLGDTLGGSFIGLFMTLITYYYVNKSEKLWLNQNLLSKTTKPDV